MSVAAARYRSVIFLPYSRYNIMCSSSCFFFLHSDIKWCSSSTHPELHCLYVRSFAGTGVGFKRPSCISKKFMSWYSQGCETFLISRWNIGFSILFSINARVSARVQRFICVYTNSWISRKKAIIYLIHHFMDILSGIKYYLRQVKTILTHRLSERFSFSCSNGPGPW